MKKNFFLLILAAMMAVCLIPTVVMADGVVCAGGDDCTHVAAIGNMHYETLQGALNVANDGDTVKLLKDTNLTENVTINKSITLDLAGKKIETNSYCMNVVGCEVTITGEGVMNNDVEGVTEPETPRTIIYVNENSNLTIKNGTFTTKAFMAIVTDNSQLTVEDGTFSCTSNNHYDMKSLIKGINGAVMNILGGTIECYSNFGEYEGMYGVYTRGPAEEALEKKATVLNLGKVGSEGPTIHSYYAPIATNGSYAPVKINVYSGTFIGDCDYSDAEEDMNVIQLAAQSSDGSEVNIHGGTFNQTAKNNKISHAIEIRYGAKKAVNIYGGLFSSASSVIHKNESSKEANTAVAITGGYYTSDVSTDVPSGYVCEALAETDPNYDYGYRYIVKPADVVIEPVEVNEITGVITVGERTIEVKNENGGELSEDEAKKAAQKINETLENPSVTGFKETNMEEATKVTPETTIQNVDGTQFDLSMILDAVKKEANKKDKIANARAYNNNQIAVDPKEGEEQNFTDESLTKQLNIELTAAAVEKSEGQETTTVTKMTFEVTPTATIIVTNGDGEKVKVTAKIPNEAITAPITFRLPVDSSVTETWAAVYHEGVFMGNYKIQGTAGSGKYIEVSSSKFSEFAYMLINSEKAVASVNRTLYLRLSDAIDEVKNLDTVVLLKGSNENVVVSRAVIFKLYTDEDAVFTGRIGAGKGYKLNQVGDMYTVTKAPTLIERIVAGLAAYTGLDIIKSTIYSCTVKPFKDFYNKCCSIFPTYQKLFKPFSLKKI